MIVCHCMRVRDSEIKKYKSLRVLQKETCATLGCGGCTKAVVEILTKEKKDK